MYLVRNRQACSVSLQWLVLLPLMLESSYIRSTSKDYHVEKRKKEKLHSGDMSARRPRVTLTVMRCVDGGHPDATRWGWQFTSLSSLPEIISPVYSWEKHQAKLSWGTFYKISDQSSLKLSRSLKNQDVWVIFTTKRSSRGLDDWVWPGILDGVLRQKMHNREKLGKTEKKYELYLTIVV